MNKAKKLINLAGIFMSGCEAMLHGEFLHAERHTSLAIKRDGWHFVLLKCDRGSHPEQNYWSESTCTYHIKFKDAMGLLESPTGYFYDRMYHQVDRYNMSCSDTRTYRYGWAK